MNRNSFIEKRYRREKEIIDATKAQKRKARTWLSDSNLGSWRHRRMISGVDPILATYPKATWLTVGDGRYGKEAHYIWKKGGNVVASNISGRLLKKAKKLDYIPKYIVENAERLSLKDGSFDFVLCQESLHHFPRPFVGLYEMIRVAGKAVIFTEPNDIFHNHSLGQKLFWNAKMAVKKMLGIGEIPPFETVGNYIYRISLPEVEKIAIALNFPVITYKGINDKYYDGVEFSDTKRSVLSVKVKFWIWLLDSLCFLGFLKHNCISIMIWKTKPAKTAIDAMKSSGFRIMDLPRNPYA